MPLSFNSIQTPKLVLVWIQKQRSTDWTNRRDSAAARLSSTTDYPAVISSTLHLFSTSALTAIVRGDLFLQNGIVKGALFGLIAGMFYGAFYLFTQPGRKLMDTLSYLFISTLASAIVLFIATLIKNYSFVEYDKHTWMVFLALGIGVQVFGWFLISYSQGFLPASIVAPTLLGQPVLTAILASLLINENLGKLQIIGGSIVIAGIYFVHYSKKT